MRISAAHFLCCLSLFALTVSQEPTCLSPDELTFSDLSATDSVPICFCRPSNSANPGEYNIRCLRGSNSDDIARTINSLADADKTLGIIHTTSLSLGAKGQPVNFFEQVNLYPKEVQIAECSGNVFFEANAFEGAEFALLRLNISRCPLRHIPRAFRSLESLELLQMRECLLKDLPQTAFAGMRNLEILDLSYNAMTEIHHESFLGLRSLQTLLLGPGNRLNEAIFPAINTLNTLQSLWMPFGKVKTLPPGGLNNLTKLHDLMLPRNHLEQLNVGAFEGLEKLVEFDLRVNLIQRIDDAVFLPLVNLETLYLDANYIVEVNPKTFLGLKRLKQLGLAFNELEILKPETFNQLESLESLDLHHNPKLKFISPRAFEGLRNLKKLNLSDSNLVILDERVFEPLGSLEILDLSRSPIGSLSPSNFRYLTKLRELRLAGAQLTTIPVGMFSTLPNLDIIDISENPWGCDTELVGLIYWIQRGYQVGLQTGSKVRIDHLSETLCSSPRRMLGKPIAWIDLGALIRREFR